MLTQAATILCVEPNDEIVGSRCAVLGAAGYTALLASPELAKTILSQRRFDLIVTSGLSDSELSSIAAVADGAELLVLGKLLLPTVLLFLVDERLRQIQAGLMPRPVVSKEKVEVKRRPAFLPGFL